MAFLEEYTLLDELGQGGYATVYKVRHNKLGYIRAIRVLNATIARGETDPTYQKFLEECKLLLRLGNGNHPGIVHIYQPLLKAQKAIVEMDFVDGKDLYHYLNDKHSFVEINDVLRLLSDIGSALAYCHEDIYKFCMDKEEDELQDDPNDGSKVLLDDETKQRLINKYRVIHNDIHSGNIIRREDGSYVLLDFGLAIEGDNVLRSSRRKNGAPEFKAPEKWDNDGILTTQSDIYSFGVVLYEFLTGRVPFIFDKEKSNPVEAEYLLGKAHKEQQPPSIYELRKLAFEQSHIGECYEKDYPDWLEVLIMKCLSKSTEDRFKNGKELYSFVLEHNNSELETLKQEIAKLLLVEPFTDDDKPIGNSQEITKDVERDELQVKVESRLKETECELQNALNIIAYLKKENKTLQKDNTKFRNNLYHNKGKVLAWRILSFAFICIALFMYLNNTSNNKDKLDIVTVNKIIAERDSLQNILTTLNSRGSNIESDKFRNEIANKDKKISALTNQVNELNKEVATLKSNQSSPAGENSHNDTDAKDQTIKQLNVEISKLKKHLKNDAKQNEKIE